MTQQEMLEKTKVINKFPDKWNSFFYEIQGLRLKDGTIFKTKELTGYVNLTSKFRIQGGSNGGSFHEFYFSSKPEAPYILVRYSENEAKLHRWDEQGLKLRNDMEFKVRMNGKFYTMNYDLEKELFVDEVLNEKYHKKIMLDDVEDIILQPIEKIEYSNKHKLTL
jgi:hypothetical protein